MKKIGGFFELELPEGKSLYHAQAIALSTGRACLHFILKVLKPSNVYIPFYCCDALFEPLQELRIPFKFYAINHDLEITTLPQLKNHEFIVYTDFFGIKSNYIRRLVNHYGTQLIIDNTHSFFQKRMFPNIASFTSARKYFGVPDGAFLYMPLEHNLDLELPRNINISLNHSMHRLMGLQNLSYQEYVAYEKSLGAELKQISVVSKRLLSLVDYEAVRRKRNENYQFYYVNLTPFNKLNISKEEKDCFCYPLLLERPIDKQLLVKEGIFVPNLWLDAVNRKNADKYPLACKFSQELLPLPIDHRYSKEDIERVCSILSEIINF